jgi:hypothetical protein
MSQDILAWECRDKEDQARVAYSNPLRRSNQVLSEENMRLKKILRENGIAWSAVAQSHIQQTSSSKRRTRSSMTSKDLGRPHLPMEVILRILKFAMTSSHPIIDPLSPLTPTNLTEKEKTRGNQIAIHFLATCRVLNEEGLRYLWGLNSFVFTTPQAVNHFSELKAVYRNSISHITFRIIARYYDDQNRRHKLDRVYHHDLRKDVRLRVNMRPREVPLIRGGFRSYTWMQIVDFLTALRAPYDPNVALKLTPRPKLLPSLASLRLDLVNFSDTLLPFSGSDFHDVTSHEFGCTLNELQVTGMPRDDAGMKGSAELSGLLKDEGLYLDAPASFVAHYNKPLQPLSGAMWCGRVIRAWRDKDDDSASDGDHGSNFPRNHPKIGVMPPAPEEEGHPPSSRDDDEVIWKRVPAARDDVRRNWVQFSRANGYEVSDSDDEGYCPCCGDSHPGSSFLNFWDDESFED